MLGLILYITPFLLVFAGLGFMCWYSNPERPWMQKMYRRRMHQRLIELHGQEHADKAYPEFALNDAPHFDT